MAWSDFLSVYPNQFGILDTIELHRCLTDRLRVFGCDRRSYSIQLLGRPIVDDGSGKVHRFRSQKSWALLAYLISADRPPSRKQLASLLFGAADDPLRALRWSIGEIRRALGEDGSIEGDPVLLRLPAGTSVDVNVVTRGAWGDTVLLPGLGQELLEGAAFRNAATFESWLLSERHHLDAGTEAILHEASVGMMTQSNYERAIHYAVRLIGINPLDENHQALLIRLYRLTGDTDAANRQFAACTDLLRTELGTSPGPAVSAALRAMKIRVHGPTDTASVEATVEAGLSAVRAGAIEAGVQSLRNGVAMADAGNRDRLRVTSRLALAEALIHSLRGQDEEGVAALHVADRVGMAINELTLLADACAEIGYVDFLRARYDRAELRLTEARDLGRDSGSAVIVAKTEMYLGAIASDRGNYAEATTYLEQALRASRAAGEVRMECFALSMFGRVHLIRHDYEEAARYLDLSRTVLTKSLARVHAVATGAARRSRTGAVQYGRGFRISLAGLCSGLSAWRSVLGGNLGTRPCIDGRGRRAVGARV